MASSSNLTLRTQRLGPLPVINHFLHRMGLDELLAEFVPTTDRRQQVSHAKALGVLVRSLLVEREAIYRQQDVVSSFAPEAFGVDRDEANHLGDDVTTMSSGLRRRRKWEPISAAVGSQSR